eukprot:gene14249-20222_t
MSDAGAPNPRKAEEEFSSESDASSPPIKKTITRSFVSTLARPTNKILKLRGQRSEEDEEAVVLPCPAASQTSDGDEAGGDDTPVGDPITPPAPLDVDSVNMLIPGKPLSVFAALTDPDSAYLKAVMGREALRDVNIPAWEPAADKTETRKVTYVRPLNIPLAPKQCDVEEVHTVKLKSPGGFILERKVSTNAPKGDAFFVLIQEVGVWDPASKSTRLTSSFKIEIVKSLGMLKGVVMSGATSSTKAGGLMWAQELAKFMGNKVGGIPRSATESGPAAPASRGPVAGGMSSSPPPSEASGLQSIEQIVRMLCFLLIAIGVYQLGLGVRGMANGLKKMVEVLATDDHFTSI